MTWQPVAVLAYTPGGHRVALSTITGPTGTTLAHLRCQQCTWQEQTSTISHAHLLAGVHARATTPEAGTR